MEIFSTKYIVLLFLQKTIFATCGSAYTKYAKEEINDIAIHCEEREK